MLSVFRTLRDTRSQRHFSGGKQGVRYIHQLCWAQHWNGNVGLERVWPPFPPGPELMICHFSQGHRLLPSRSHSQPPLPPSSTVLCIYICFECSNAVWGLCFTQTAAWQYCELKLESGCSIIKTSSEYFYIISWQKIGFHDNCSILKLNEFKNIDINLRSESKMSDNDKIKYCQIKNIDIKICLWLPVKCLKYLLECGHSNMFHS